MTLPEGRKSGHKAMRVQPNAALAASLVHATGYVTFCLLVFLLLHLTTAYHRQD